MPRYQPPLHAAAEEDVIENEEREFIASVIEFGDTVVREIMVPRPDIVHVDDVTPVREALDLAVASGRSRLPVVAEGIDDVVGMVNLRHLAALAALVDRGEISGKMAKELLPEVMEGGDPQELVAARGLRAVRDETTLTEAIEATLREQRELAERVISGSNPKAIHALFGQVMRRTGGAAQPERLRDLLRARLERLAAERAERP